MASSELSGIWLEWADLTYVVPDPVDKNAQKQILHPQTGSVAPGEMLAIMGPSGCGKSSLINILAQRRRGEDSVSGSMKVNGAEIEQNHFSRLSGYVTQDFLFFEHLTVKETLTISAMLRLPRAWNAEQKHTRVERLLSELDLTKAADTMVGSPVSLGASAGDGGISGGERRRLCIAMELMNNPPLLFLDEPTSGLDSASAMMVVNVLKKLAGQGKTVVCVIHQPRASILPLFDRVLLLGAGQTIYYGPSCDFSNGAKSDPLRDFFASAGHTCPPFENPADHILDIINLNQNDKEEDATAAAAGGGGGGGETAGLQSSEVKLVGSDQRSAVVGNLVAAYKASAVPVQMQALMGRGPIAQATLNPTGLEGPEGPELGRSKYATSWVTQFSVLFSRTLKLKYRDPMSFWTVIGGVISVALLMGSIYYGLNEGDVRNRISGIAMYVSFMSFMTFDILMLWPAERSVYLRDQVSGMYCTSAFFIARSCAELPTHSLAGVLGSLIIYYMYGLSTDADNVVMFAFISVVTVYSASAIMMFVSSLAKNFEQSNQLLMPVLLPCMFFSGFFIPENLVPSGWKWVPDVNFLYYSTNYAVVREVQIMEGGCGGASTYVMLTMGCNDTTTAAAAATADSSSQLDECNRVLVASGFDPEMSFGSFLMCHVWTNLLFRLLSYLGLRFCWTGQTIKQRLEL